MSEQLLDYPGLRYAYNAQQAADSAEYATKDAFTGSPPIMTVLRVLFPPPKPART